MDMTVTTPTQIPAPFGEAAKAKHDRILVELEKLKTAEALEAKETEERKRLLTEGSDEEVDACDNRIDAARAEQVRVLERVDLLIGQLVEANANARQSILNNLRARANAAREIGEGLIRKEYAKYAKLLATTMAKLDSIRIFIRSANHVLERAGENEPVDSPNHIRQQGRIQREKKVIRTVNIFHPGHPHYGKAVIPYNRQGSLPAKLRLEAGGECDTEVEIEEVVMEDDGPYWNQELPESVVLPTIEPTGAPLWDGERIRRHGSDNDDELLTELGIDATLPEVK
jgi:hypothetical protein